MADVTLVEDISTDPQVFLVSIAEDDTDEETESDVTHNKTDELNASINRFFRLIVETRNQPAYSATFMADDENHKSEWCSDIGQCLQNLRYTNLLTETFRNQSSVIAPESVK